MHSTKSALQRGRTRRNLYLLLLAAAVLYILYHFSTGHPDRRAYNGSKKAGKTGSAAVLDGPATSGKVWKAERTRSADYSITSFLGRWKDAERGLAFESSGGSGSGSGSGSSSPCNGVWAVTTTIFKPGDAITKLLETGHFCLCVVLDRKSPMPYPLAPSKLVTILDPSDQERLPFDTVAQIPWNHFGRKNIGYLYAAYKGAKIIYDFDDDNVPKQSASGTSAEMLVDQVVTGKWRVRNVFRTSSPPSDVNYSFAYNAYPYFGLADAWPRGFPLDRIQSPDRISIHTASRMRLTEAEQEGTDHKSSSLLPNFPNVWVLQSLADVDPDVDGIYRLTRGVPKVFTQYQKETAMICSPGTFCSYNAQATFYSREAFWGLLLPVTVTGRVSDIWRGYITQRIMWLLGGTMAYASPMVDQYRNPHNYLGDVVSEQQLYNQAGELNDFLHRWQPDCHCELPAILQLAIELYEHEFSGEADVVLFDAFLGDLYKMGLPVPSESCYDSLSPPPSSGGSSSSISSNSGRTDPNKLKVAVCAVGEIGGAALSIPMLRDTVLHSLNADLLHVYAVMEKSDRNIGMLQYFKSKQSRQLEPQTEVNSMLSRDNAPVLAHYLDLQECAALITEAEQGFQYDWIVVVGADTALQTALPPLHSIPVDAVITNVECKSAAGAYCPDFLVGQRSRMMPLLTVMDSVGVGDLQSSGGDEPGNLSGINILKAVQTVFGRESIRVMPDERIRVITTARVTDDFDRYCVETRFSATGSTVGAGAEPGQPLGRTYSSLPSCSSSSA